MNQVTGVKNIYFVQNRTISKKCRCYFTSVIKPNDLPRLMSEHRDSRNYMCTFSSVHVFVSVLVIQPTIFSAIEAEPKQIQKIRIEKLSQLN